MKENLFKKSWNFDPTQNFVKCPKVVKEAPRAIQKIKKNLAQKGPRPNFGPRVGGMRRQPLKFGRSLHRLAQCALGRLRFSSMLPER